MAKQDAGVLADQLDRLRHVHRVPSPTDGSAQMIVIAQNGRRVVEVA
ncbi:hypothetical protein [Streptomyces sp. NPDC096311]